MSEKLLNTIFVVEGKNDSERFKKLGVPYIVRTDGTKVPRETINHLWALSLKHRIVALTDPDGPGRYISGLLEREILNITVLEIEKKFTTRKEKLGIENMPLPLLNAIITPYIGKEYISKSNVKFSDLVSLNLSGPGSKQRKLIIADKFNLLYGSLKNMYTQILLLDIKLIDLVEALNE